MSERTLNVSEKDASRDEEATGNYTCQYSDGFLEILQEKNISLAFTSYQASRVCFIRSGKEGINIHLRQFSRPMGIYADEKRITLGTFSEVVDFRKSAQILHEVQAGMHDSDANLSRKVKEKAQQAREILRNRKSKEINQLKKSDAIYIARSSHNTCMINIHDIAWGKEGLWAVNSTFSCLSTITTEANFVAHWKPPFISELVPEDRCHLNGMAMRDGEPRYVTTFNQNDHLDSWQVQEAKGTLIDIRNNNILKNNLFMPHSPRYYEGFIYVCNSGEGTVLQVDPDTGDSQVLIELPGFTRGINFFQNLMFVATSKIRMSNVEGKPLPLQEKTEKTYSGVWVYCFVAKRLIAKLIFSDSVEQIYDIAVIPESNAPDMVSNNMICARHLFERKERML